MKRDVLGTMGYWNKWVDYSKGSILNSIQIDAQPGGDLDYRPQYVFEIANDYLEQMLCCYSRGDAVSSLAQNFDGLLGNWEKSEELGADVWTSEIRYTRDTWKVNLDFYHFCFWVAGLALCLNVTDTQWQRLVNLMGNEGEDALLDRVIARRQSGRKIGETLCFPKAYKKLYDVILASPQEQPKKLVAYVKGWYKGLKNSGNPDFPPLFRTPYWYGFGTSNFEGGAYFGHWCVEAAVVAKVFQIDDTACLSHRNYPGDLVQDNRSPRYPDDFVAH